MSESNTKQMIQLNHVKFGYSDTEVLEEINQEARSMKANMLF